MCFYPVCIILRPAAALSAAARAHSGPGSPFSCSRRAFGLADRTAAFVAEPGQKRSLLITRGRHSGAAELLWLESPPHTPFPLRPACSPQGAAEGRESERGGWSSREPASPGLTSAWSGSPGAPWRSWTGRASGPRFSAGPGRARPRGWGHRLHITPGFLPILIVGTFVFHNSSSKVSAA